MRDLKRRHAKLPPYKMFENFEGAVFHSYGASFWSYVGGKRVDQEVPFMQDLLFRERHEGAS